MEVFGRRYSLVIGKPEKWVSLNKSPVLIPAKGDLGSTSYSPVVPPSDKQAIDRTSVPSIS